MHYSGLEEQTYSEVIVGNCSASILALSVQPASASVNGSGICGVSNLGISFGQIDYTTNNTGAALVLSTYPFQSFDDVLVAELSISGNQLTNSSVNVTQSDSNSHQSIIIFFGSDAWFNITALKAQLHVSEKTRWEMPVAVAQLNRTSSTDLRFRFSFPAFKVENPRSQ